MEIPDWNSAKILRIKAEIKAYFPNFKEAKVKG